MKKLIFVILILGLLIISVNAIPTSVYNCYDCSQEVDEGRLKCNNTRSCCGPFCFGTVQCSGLSCSEDDICERSPGDYVQCKNFGIANVFERTECIDDHWVQSTNNKYGVCRTASLGCMFGGICYYCNPDTGPLGVLQELLTFTRLGPDSDGDDSDDYCESYPSDGCSIDYIYDNWNGQGCPQSCAYPPCEPFPTSPYQSGPGEPCCATSDYGCGYGGYSGRYVLSTPSSYGTCSGVFCGSPSPVNPNPPCWSSCTGASFDYTLVGTDSDGDGVDNECESYDDDPCSRYSSGDNLNGQGCEDETLIKCNFVSGDWMDISESNKCCGDDASDNGFISTDGYICTNDGGWAWERFADIVYARWTDMLEGPISVADNLDRVKIITSSEYIFDGEQITVEIYESQTLFELGILDWLVQDNLVDTIIQTVDTDGKGVVEWTIPDVSETTYYYAYSYFQTYTSEPTWYLEVSPDEDNSPPVVIIDDLPSYIVLVNDSVCFTQSSYDVDGTIDSYSWDFDTGANPATSDLADPLCVTYSTAGTKYVSLTITDDKGSSLSGYSGVLVDDPATNQAPLVILSSPKAGEMYFKTVPCDASNSIDDNTVFDDLIFTWYFDNVEDLDHANVRGGNGGATFIKSFDMAGPHSVAVIVDDGE